MGRETSALSAPSVGELAELTVDLPTAACGVEVKGLARIVRRRGAAVRGEGRVAPRRLESESSRGDVPLDLTQAVMATGTRQIDLDMRGGTLSRPHARLRRGHRQAVIDYAEINARPAGGAGAPVVLRVEGTGRMRYGRVVVRPPPRTPFRRTRTP